MLVLGFRGGKGVDGELTLDIVYDTDMLPSPRLRAIFPEPRRKRVPRGGFQHLTTLQFIFYDPAKTMELDAHSEPLPSPILA